MAENSCTLDKARAAKLKAAVELAGLPVVGIGITRVGEGYGLKVNLSEICESVPSEIDGVPVKPEVVGKIVKRS
jgi:hypothetical protein